MEEPPFNFRKAAFYLVAGTIATHMVIVLSWVGACIAHFAAIAQGTMACDPDARLDHLLAETIVAVLAFAAGASDKGEKPK